jgi:2-hydroxy-6-oxonona-2,4-dienedioate hydrolase
VSSNEENRLATKIFKSEAAQKRLEAWYDKFLAHIPGSVEHRDVPTVHGPSHVLLAGDPAKPPLVVLHGSLASSAHMVPELGPLLDRYRIIAPDIPGQSVRGPHVRLPLKDDSLARWLVEVLDGLGIGEFNLLGVSWGGFVARQTAGLIPARVRRLVLVVPAGIVSGPLLKGFTRMAWPMVMYRLFPSERRLRKLVTPLFSTWDDDWAHFFGDAIRDFKLDLRIPPVATDEQLRALTMPVLVIGAGEDVSFPGAKLVARVKALVPKVETELVAGSKHCPPTTDEFRTWLADRVTRFIEAG